MKFSEFADQAYTCPPDVTPVTIYVFSKREDIRNWLYDYNNVPLDDRDGPCPIEGYWNIFFTYKSDFDPYATLTREICESPVLEFYAAGMDVFAVLIGLRKEETNDD